MKRIVLFALLLAPIAVAYAQDKPLTGDEIKALITGKTIRWARTAQGTLSNFKLEPGGTGSGSSNNSNWRNTISYPVKWRVDDSGNLCTHVQQVGYNEYCSPVQKAADGSYQCVRNEKIERTFTVD